MGTLMLLVPWAIHKKIWLPLSYGLGLGPYMKFQEFQEKARLAIRSLEPRGPSTGPGSPVKGFWICRRIYIEQNVFKHSWKKSLI